MEELTQQDIRILSRMLRTFGRLKETLAANPNAPLHKPLEDVGGCGPISGREAMILIHIYTAPQGRMSVKELAASMNTTSSAASQAISALEKRGLLERASDPRDRRVVYVRIPETHRQMIEERGQCLIAQAQSWLRCIEPQDRLALARILDATEQWLDGNCGGRNV